MEPQAALDAPRFRLDGVDSCIGPASVNDVTCALLLVFFLLDESCQPDSAVSMPVHGMPSLQCACRPGSREGA